MQLMYCLIISSLKIEDIYNLTLIEFYSFYCKKNYLLAKMAKYS